MMSEDDFDHINEAKTNLDHIYDQPDPRAYFRELNKFDYSIPDAAKPIFQKLISCLRRRGSDTVRILDLGCSYGVNAALLKHDLSMPDLYEHWGTEKLATAEPEQVVEIDHRYFAELEEAEDIEMIGLDPCKNAVRYAEEVGLLDDSLALNLEIDRLTETAEEQLASVDLVMSTGCVGYVSERSFDRLLPAVTRGTPPWIANFVLRLFPFAEIEKTLANWGYVTEKLEGHTFVQRRFTSPTEQEQVLEQLRDAGVDATGGEAEGHLLAEFYLSRPRRDAAAFPLGGLFAG